MKFAGIAVFLAASVLSVDSAGAQTSNGLTPAPQVLQRIGASDVAAMMAELGVTSKLQVVADGGSPVLVAMTPGNGRFLFRFFACDDPAAAEGCANTVVSTAFPSAGMTYDSLNYFNGRSQVTTAVNLADSQIVILGRNILVYGGHSRDLFKSTVYLFLRDVQTFVESQAATSVAFSPTPEKGSKILGLRAIAVTGEEPMSVFGESDFSPDIAAAVGYSQGDSFLVEYSPGD